MAGARALWVANGMKKEQMGKPIIAIANSFTQFVPGHTHLHEAGQIIKKEIEKLGCFAAEFNTIAIDDGIAMGHDGMLYSLPSRDIIADSVEYPHHYTDRAFQYIVELLSRVCRRMNHRNLSRVYGDKERVCKPVGKAIGQGLKVIVCKPVYNNSFILAGYKVGDLVGIFAGKESVQVDVVLLSQAEHDADRNFGIA